MSPDFGVINAILAQPPALPLVADLLCSRPLPHPIWLNTCQLGLKPGIPLLERLLWYLEMLFYHPHSSSMLVPEYPGGNAITEDFGVCNYLFASPPGL